MKTNEELVEYLNGLKIHQTSDWYECIPEDIWNEYFEDKFKVVDSELDIDKHRWYELSTEVLAINGGYIGVRSVTQCYSEQSSIDDMYHRLEFFEMEQIQTVTYKKINK